MKTTIDAHSIGNIACNLQTSVRNVQRIAAKLSLEPTLLLDNVPHYAERQVEQIRKHLGGSK